MWEYLARKISPRNRTRESSDIHPTGRPHRPDASSPVEGHDHRNRSPGDRAGRRLRCPVCGVWMQRKWIGRVEVDQCPECYGIFLDRGELKALSGEERSSYQHDTGSENTLIYTPHGLSAHVREDPGHHEP